VLITHAFVHSLAQVLPTRSGAVEIPTGQHLLWVLMATPNHDGTREVPYHPARDKSETLTEGQPCLRRTRFFSRTVQARTFTPALSERVPLAVAALLTVAFASTTWPRTLGLILRAE
jgi:hypothetical protein